MTETGLSVSVISSLVISSLFRISDCPAAPAQPNVLRAFLQAARSSRLLTALHLHIRLHHRGDDALECLRRRVAVETDGAAFAAERAAQRGEVLRDLEVDRHAER